jgi:hypothetical protein
MISIKISQTIAPAVTVVAEAATFERSEIEERPNPAPRDNKISDRAAVTNPPARTADQDTPEALDSFGDNSARPPGIFRPERDDIVFSIDCPFLQYLKSITR